MRRLVLVVSGVVCLTTALTGPLPAQSADTVRPDSARAAADSVVRASATSVPTLRVTRMVRGLNQPWDVKYTRAGRLLITERSGRLLTWRLGKLRQVSFPSSTVWASGETGLMSLAIDPAYESN